MYNLSELQLWREHRDDLLREAERRRLIGELATQGKGFRLRDYIRARLEKRVSSSDRRESIRVWELCKPFS